VTSFFFILACDMRCLTYNLSLFMQRIPLSAVFMRGKGKYGLAELANNPVRCVEFETVVKAAITLGNAQ
jgi:hypothetical protein